MEKREHRRFNSTNLLSYACINTENIVVQQGMGKTLDVSQGGILLETHVPIDPSHKVHLDIGFRDEVVKMVGDVVYTRTGQSGRSESGIHFVEHSEKDHEILLRFIDGFQCV